MGFSLGTWVSVWEDEKVLKVAYYNSVSVFNATKWYT